MIRLSEPIIDKTTLAAISEVLMSGQLASGAQVEAFQERFSTIAAPGTQCVAVNSGTAALHVALLAAGIGPGDEVILPAFTFAGTANAVAATGATPVFADVEPDTALINLKHVDSLVTSSTAAIIPVHLYGNPVDMTKCMQLGRKYGLFVLEDAAQAHLAKHRGQPVGTLGHAAAFSFYATKNMTTGEGGMITTLDQSFAERCRVLRNQGQIHRYEHTVPGWNYRMTNIAAAIGLSQLTHIAEWTFKRQDNASAYEAMLPKNLLIHRDKRDEHVFHQFTLRVPDGDREQLREHLKRYGVQSDVYYPTPLHKQPAFLTTQYLPGAEKLSKNVLSIPVHPSLTPNDVDYVAESLISFVNTSHTTAIGDKGET